MAPLKRMHPAEELNGCSAVEGSTSPGSFSDRGGGLAALRHVLYDMPPRRLTHPTRLGRESVGEAICARRIIVVLLVSSRSERCSSAGPAGGEVPGGEGRVI